MSGRPSDEDIARADIVMAAEVEADDLEVKVAPDHQVEFHGDDQAASGTNRENLPESVTDGARYRSVRISYALQARAARVNPT
ncbi:hypothetical protein FDA94_37690 [Herbidospora galbida]|uniref:Uncharacterized protein n=1 Tax=Herbidospora galbida TaxID=2575442 RepID=A0A4U3LNJ2_9ACTN|nr:hypothetical protein [Herbidospora galbida]TKK77361.1 hypothetical protein FDA94_37690 [Herbidospora galbida]